MEKKSVEEGILADIVEYFLNNGVGPDIRRFRADNYKLIKSIENLQRTGVLESDDQGRFKVPLLQLVGMSAWTREARITESVMKTAAELYLDSPGEMRPVGMFHAKAGIGVKPFDIQRALIYLRTLGLIHGYRTDDKSGYFTDITPDEQLLDDTPLEERIQSYDERRRTPPQSRIAQLISGLREVETPITKTAEPAPVAPELPAVELLIGDAASLEVRGQKLLDQHVGGQADYKVLEAEMRKLANDFAAFSQKVAALVSKFTPHNLSDTKDSAERGQRGANSMREYIKDRSEHHDVFDWFLESVSELRGSCEAIKMVIAPAGATISKDPLLSISARDTLEKSLPGLIDRCRAQKQPLSVAMLDVDRFKKFNDDYGHSTGDDVLKITAIIIKNAVGQKGEVIRYGGEEIIVLLPNFSAPEALATAERIRSEIEAYAFKGPNREILKITASIGIRTADATETLTSKQIVDQADSALLKAKKDGRNRVEVALVAVK